MAKTKKKAAAAKTKLSQAEYRHKYGMWASPDGKGTNLNQLGAPPKKMVPLVRGKAKSAKAGR